MPYDLFEHRHRFSVWAAARATQRGFTTVDNLRDALQSTDIAHFVRKHVTDRIDANGFAIRHGKWCDNIVEFLLDAGIQNVSFGRAAKLVAVYLKSMVVVGPYANSSLAQVAHPPIDRLLLQALSRLEDLPREARRIFRTTNWTDLKREEYYALIERIRVSVPDLNPFWHLERYWTVTQYANS